jgi:hypothetical protein
MLIRKWKQTVLALTMGVLLTSISTNVKAEDSAVGIARIGDSSQVTARQAPVIRANNEEEVYADGAVYSRHTVRNWWWTQKAAYATRIENNIERGHYNKWSWNAWWADQACQYRARNASENQKLHNHHRCKWGYFYPTGCGGAGCPWMGKYQMVYAVDPGYTDARDSRLYSAQGAGVPMAVPLAPNVRHTYNYSWGLPASRLTPISNVGQIPAY